MAIVCLGLQTRHSCSSVGYTIYETAPSQKRLTKSLEKVHIPAFEYTPVNRGRRNLIQINLL